MFHNVWMHKSSKQSHFQQEQSVALNSTTPNTRCPEGRDSASMRDRSSYKPWAVPSNLPIKETVRMGLQPMPCRQVRGSLRCLAHSPALSCQGT